MDDKKKIKQRIGSRRYWEQGRAGKCSCVLLYIDKPGKSRPRPVVWQGLVWTERPEESKPCEYMSASSNWRSGKISGTTEKQQKSSVTGLECSASY